MEEIHVDVDRYCVWRESEFSQFVVSHDHVFNNEVDGLVEFVFKAIVEFTVCQLQVYKWVGLIFVLHDIIKWLCS